MEKIKGLIDAPFTPFYENGEVNYEPIEAYAKLLVKNGLKGVFINGSSGEGYMLTDEERMKLAERWVEVAPDGFKVIVHVGSTCVKASHKLAAHAQKIGAWGIGAMASPFPKLPHHRASSAHSLHDYNNASCRFFPVKFLPVQWCGPFPQYTLRDIQVPALSAPVLWPLPESQGRENRNIPLRFPRSAFLRIGRTVSQCIL